MKKTTKKKSVKKNPSGRPKIQLDLEQVEELASRGLSNEQIAYSLGIGQTTLYVNKRENADFVEAIKRGKAKGIRDVANALVEKALSGDTTAMIFFLKSQAQWREINRTELTGADGGTVKTEQLGALSNAELMAIAGMKDEVLSGTSAGGKKRTEKKSG